MPDAVTVSHLYKSYITESAELAIDGRRPEPVTREVLHDLSLEFPAGKLSVLVGRSGCGKSTLLRLLNGEDKPDRGTITLPEGWHSTLLSPSPYVITWTTLKHNVEMAAGAGRGPEERSALADELLEAVHLSEYADMTPAALSTGMRQRLGLARVLAGRSELLLMDEPFASLDFITREELQQELLAVQARLRRTVVLVTHQLEEALLLGDSITVLHMGGGMTRFDLGGLPFPRGLDSPALKELARAVREACRNG